MPSKVVLITGANTGLGFEIVKALWKSETKYSIILAGRSFDNAQNAVKSIQTQESKSSSTVVALQLDVTDDDSISTAFEKVSSEFGVLDILVNNAGASFDIPIQEGKMSTREGWAITMDTNITGTHIVTETFVPLLLKSSDPRLIFITSGTASLEETYGESHINAAPPKGWPKPKTRSIISYRTSKVGLNMLMREWEKMLRADGVKVWCIAPGFLATGLGGEREMLKKLGALDPSVGGESVKKVIEGARDADAGKVVRHYASPVQPW